MLTWTAPKLPHVERSHRWYSVAGSIVVGIAAYGILTGAWTVSLVAILCGVLYVLLRGHVPADSTITLSETGVLLDQAQRRWDELQGFWILPLPTYTEIHFTPKRSFTPELIIQTGNMDVTTLREFLHPHLPELAERQESILDTFIRICKL